MIKEVKLSIKVIRVSEDKKEAYFQFQRRHLTSPNTKDHSKEIGLLKFNPDFPNTLPLFEQDSTAIVSGTLYLQETFTDNTILPVFVLEPHKIWALK